MISTKMPSFNLYEPRSVSRIQIDFRPIGPKSMDSRPKRLSFDQGPFILIFDRWAKKWPIFDRKDGVSTMMAANAPHPNNNDRVGTFQEKTVPAEARLAGWAWLVHRFGAQAPVRSSSVVSDQHVK